MGHKVLIISGLVDAQISGNQSYPQTVKGLCQGWRLSLLSGTPRKVQNIDYDFSEKYFEYQNRGGGIYQRVFALSKGKHKNSPKVKKNDALADYDNKAAFLMTCFSFILAIKLAIEYFLDPKLRGIKYLYCYENIGSLAGIIIQKIQRDVRVVRRFQGTPIPLNPSDRKFSRFGSFICALKWSNSPVIMANDGTNGDLICSQLTPNSPIFFERNGLPDHLLKIKRDQTRILSSTVKITAVSKLKAWKRLDKVFSECRKISDANPDYHVILQVVGDGPEYRNLQAQKQKFETTNFAVLFHGAKSHEDAMALLSSSDFFISNYDVSNLGNPLLEAAYLKVPILIKREPQIELLLGHDYPGFLDSVSNIGIEDLHTYCLRFLESRPARVDTWNNRMKRELDFLLLGEMGFSE